PPPAPCAHARRPAHTPPERPDGQPRGRALGGRAPGAPPPPGPPFRHLHRRSPAPRRRAPRLREHRRGHGIDRGLLASRLGTLGDPWPPGPAERPAASHTRPRAPANRSARRPVAPTPPRLRPARSGLPPRRAARRPP